MRRRAWITLPMSIAAIGICLIAAGADAPRGHTVETLAWRLEQAKVNPGISQNTPEGYLVKDLVIRSKAISVGDAEAPDGECHMVLTVFRPSKESPGQKKDRWYVNGTWRIGSAPAVESRNRHTSGVVEGTVAFELDTDPLTYKGSLATLVRLQMRRIEGRWHRGEGTFVGNSRFEGVLSLTVDRYPGQ